jgi:PAS domain S-box-containing protein
MEYSVHPREDTATHFDVAALPAQIDKPVSFALAAAHIGVFDWDPDSDGLTWWSGTTGLGMNREQAPTSGRAFFELVHPDDRLAVRETRVRAIRDRIDAISEFRIVGSDGAVHWVQGHGRIVYDADGRPTRVLGVNTEITHRKSLEEQLREAHVAVAHLHALKATTRTVQEIVANALMEDLRNRNEISRTNMLTLSAVRFQMRIVRVKLAVQGALNLSKARRRDNL